MDEFLDNTPMMDLDDEKALRLVSFGAALLAITMRERVIEYIYESEAPSAPIGVTSARQEAILEARAVADAIVAEQRRLIGEEDVW